MMATHIRAQMQRSEDDPTITMVTVQVWPLPEQFVEGLATHMRDQINAYLTAVGFTTGDMSSPGKAH